MTASILEQPAAAATMLTTSGHPTWAAPTRPGQVFAGNLIFVDRGREHVVDVYVYAEGKAVGLRYGAHPRDEHTHATDYWPRLSGAMAEALLQHIEDFITTACPL